ncbi:hypothetical protein ABZ912_42515 [Nonomuraea angiospora]|uniref:hypothetical protein n=1 Tax=Nonomuraea angiospora TaxID=46172 RepID=UPI0033CF44C9
MGTSIPAWVDDDGRLWIDTGTVHEPTGEPVIELLNGQARGTLSWVEKNHGELHQLGVTRLPNGAEEPAESREVAP